MTERYNIVKTKEDLERQLMLSSVPSHTFSVQQFRLLPHELFFRENYYCRFNEVKSSYEVFKSFVDVADGEEKGEWEELSVDELHNDLLRARDGQGKKIADQDIRLMLGDRRLVPAYNPFIDYFKKLPQLSTPHKSYIDEFGAYLKVEGGEKEQQRWLVNFKKALVRTVKCAIDDSYFNKHAITLFSENQSVGKTSYLRTLCPPKLAEYYSEEPISQDKDSQIMLSTNFITLLDELATLSRLDINFLKSILSKLKVNVRLPYDKRAKTLPRRTSFFATTNRTDFLMDSQNVRWLVFNVDDIDKNYGNIFTGEMNIDIDLIWSEAYKLACDPDYICELTKEDLELNEINNSLYSASSLEREVIEEYLEPCSYKDKDRPGYRSLQPSQIYELLCDSLEKDGRDKITLSDKKFYWELNSIKGWKKTSIRDVSGRTFTGYHFFVRKDMRDNELF